MNLKKISLILAAALCFAGLSAMAEDTLTMADFAHSIALSVEGYTGTETLENFPVLVRIAEYDESTGTGIPGFLYADLTNSKGNDIAFFDELGNHLASEIQTNDWTTSGESLVWVKLPEMTHGTKFFMCYNTTESGAWVTNENPWGDYVGVWHLDEKGGTSKPIYDSTTNGLDGVTVAKGSPSILNSGRIGKARYITNQTGNKGNNPGFDSGITVSLSDSVKAGKVNELAPQFTASFWYRPNAATANYEYLLGRKSADGTSAWGLQFGSTNSNQQAWNQIRIYGGNGSSFAVGDGATAGSGDKYGMLIPSSTTTTWRKMDCVWTTDAKYLL